MKKITKNLRLIFLNTLLLTIVITYGVYPQSIVKVNRFWGTVTANGTNTANSFSTLSGFADYCAYGARLNGQETYFSGHIGIGMINWDTSGVTIPYAFFPPVNAFTSGGRTITGMKGLVRYKPPQNSKVIGNATTPLDQTIASLWGSPATAPSASCIGTSDQTIEVTNGYACHWPVVTGSPNVEVQRKVLAWSQPFHDNYVISDLTFTNKTGIALHGFYVFLQEGTYYMLYADGTTPAIAAVDQRATNTSRWYHYYGAGINDSLRVYYEYSANDPGTSWDDMGQPLSQQFYRLYDKDFFFMATLHASKAPYTPSAPYVSGTYVTTVDPHDTNDMNQPTTTTVANIQNVIGLPLYSSSFSPIGQSAQSYYNLAAGVTLSSMDTVSANIRPGHHRKNPDEMGTANPTAVGQGIDQNNFRSMIVAYGPYEFGNGQQIRIVKASGIAGISREKAMEVGQQYLAGTLQNPPNMKNPNTGSFPATFVFPPNSSEMEKRRDRWLSTGIDSVYLTVDRALYNFRHNYKVPQAPAPPDSVTVRSLSHGIRVEWRDTVAEAMTTFAGYRILKKVSSYDTTFYKEVYRSDSTDKAPGGTFHMFTDTLVHVLVSNFYYVQALAKIGDNDTNAHPSERGKIMWSSMVWFLNNTTASVAGKTVPNDPNKLNQIVIAPNPFNFKDPIIPPYNLTNPNNLHVHFFNLPRTITIRIFTEYGDLVKTVEHTDNTGDEGWSLTNQNGQTVASGIYVVVFQTPDGAVSYQKVVVVR